MDMLAVFVSVSFCIPRSAGCRDAAPVNSIHTGIRVEYRVRRLWDTENILNTLDIQ